MTQDRITVTTNTHRDSYETATGKIDYGMTNDYMFRAILQKNSVVLKGCHSHRFLRFYTFSR